MPPGGGQGFTGSTTCVSSSTCVYTNPYYSQCLPGKPTSTPSTSNPESSTLATSLAAIGESIGWRYVGSATNGPVGNCTDPTYASIFLQQFNMATTGTALTWRETQPSQGFFNFTMADKLVTWAENSDLMLRGQPLVWHTELPDWLHEKVDLTAAIKAQVAKVIGRYRTSMYAWDVVNEVFLDDGTFRPSIFYQQLGESYIDIAFRAAMGADPSGRLYINENIGNFLSKKVDVLGYLVMMLTQKGIPVDGIGIQAHFVVGQVPPSLADSLAYFASLPVLEVAITELDIRMPLPPSDANLAQQKKDYQTVFAACKKVPKCVGVSIWGLTDKYSWVPKAYAGYGAPLPWDGDYNLKPAYAGAIASMQS